jgi:hypothetical protein
VDGDSLHQSHSLAGKSSRSLNILYAAAVIIKGATQRFGYGSIAAK